MDKTIHPTIVEGAEVGVSDLLWLCRTRSTRARLISALSIQRIGGFRRYRRVEWSRVTRLVFVCKGNVCRSPYAEALARSEGIPAASCGLHAEPGRGAHPTAIDVARGRGVDLHGARARCVADVRVAESDLLVAMEPWQAQVLRRHAEGVDAQVTLLGLWLSARTPFLPDPYGGPPETFERCFDAIEQSLRSLRADMARLGKRIDGPIP